MLHGRFLKRLFKNVRWEEHVARILEKLAGRYLFWRPEPKWEFNTKTGSRITCEKGKNWIEEAHNKISGTLLSTQ
jgi:beta-lactamase class D